MATTALGFQNWFSTTLSSGITASDTTIYVNSLPTPNEGYLVLEPDSVSNREVIYYTSKGANYVTCPSAALGRGVDGSTAVSHSSGITVQMNVVAAHLEALQDGSALAETVSRSNGWFAGTSTWVYASATTFTVSAAEAAFMSVGTKIWLTQTTSKYFYVTGVSGTTITVNGGSAYSVANAAITAPYFSNVATPIGFPHWFAYTPTWGATGTAPAIGDGTFDCKFAMVGKIVNFRFRWNAGSTSTYGTGAFTFTLPVSAGSYYATASTNQSFGGSGYMENNGVLGYNAVTAYMNATLGVTKFGITVVNSAAGAVDLVGQTVPFTWGTADYINFGGTYEAA